MVKVILVKMSFTLLPAVGSDFVGRDELVDEMLRTLRSKKVRMGFALYGPRRIGKTSVLRELQRRLKGDDFCVPVYFSLWDVVDLKVESFSRLFAAEVLEAYGPKLSFSFKAKEFLSASLSSLKILLSQSKLSVKLKDSIEILLSRGEVEEDYNALVERAFALPEALSVHTGTRCVLLLDEFPDVMLLKNGAVVGEGIVRKIRTLYEEQKNTVLCVSGSVRSTMNAVAFAPTAAFYRQLIAKEIAPLEREQVLKLLERNWGEKNAAAANTIFELTGGFPFYVQWLGGALEAKASALDERGIRSAYEKLLSEQGDLLFKNWLDSFSPKERSVIIAVAVHGSTSPSQTSLLLHESVYTTANYLASLEEKGFLNKASRGNYAFEDNVFKGWLKKKFS